jgi:L-alanine-DL-glutamate epimerase-like enolase superfamily enzyme
VTIDGVFTRRTSAPLRAPFVTSLRRATTVESLIVEIRDSDGRSGYGEVPQVWAVTGESVESAEACVRQQLGPPLLGRDTDDVVANCRDTRSRVMGNLSAKAAVDVALHDLAARVHDVPLVRLLGGSTMTIDTDVTISADGPESMATAARERVAEGFTVLKLKVGADAGQDLARVAAVRSAVGDTVQIRLDANQGWTARQSVRLIREMEDAGLDIELVEQPVAHWDVEGLAWVSDRVETPVMADEAVFGVRDLTDVIRRRAADMVNVKLVKSGGIEPARTLLGLAEAHGMGTMIGSMMETSIGVGAAASLAAAQGTTVVCDLDAAWWLADPAVVGGMHYDGATLVLSGSAGLGVSGMREPADPRAGRDAGVR